MTRFRFFILLAALAGALTLHAEPLPLTNKVSLELEGVPLVQVINTLAQQNHFNVVYAGKVDGTVTMRLDGVDLASALSAVLMANGYTYVTKDDVVIVKLLSTQLPGDLSTRRFTLAYADPEAVLRAIEPQLSTRGKVIVLAPATSDKTKDVYKANALVVTDYPSILDDVAKLIGQIDIPERTILIEARIIETSIDAAKRLGFLWPSQLAGRTTGAIDATSNRNTGGMDLNSGKWLWGKLSVAQLDATLDLLETNGNSKLLSDPRITVTENHEAEIKIATVIPIQTLNRFTEGAAIQDIVSFEDEEVGISLRVTARINAEGTITLDVAPQVDDIIGYTGPANNQRPIKTTRSIRTRITVNDGESVALGGLLKDDVRKTEQRLPLLGKIPFLGKALFTRTSTEKTTTDLVIFITPKIVK
jgi:type II secretory pathway component GspD/PulD (secretin)